MINKKKFKNLIFDLDGTLINSGEGIKNALFESFLKAKLKMSLEKNQIKIGPPLSETIKECNENLSDFDVDAIKNYFVDIYDNQLFKDLDVFPNVDLLLNRLSTFNLKIYIATNKRYIPTVKILEYLSWTKFFVNVYSIDKYVYKFNDKAQMLNKLLTEENLFAEETIYIGDRYSDFIASNKNRIFFIGANWGDSDFSDFKTEFQIIDKLDSQTINYLVSLFS